MFDNNVGNRSVGVGIPMGQLSPGTGQPRTLTGFMVLQNVAIEYVDDQGNKHRTIAMVDSAGTWYLPPNGENFAATLRPLGVGTWLSKLLVEKLESLKSAAQSADQPVPDEDSVNVVT
jgi:hypothetical protein